MAAPGTNTVYLRQTYAEDVSQYVNINEHTGTAPEIPFAWVEMPIHWYASEGEIHHYLIHFFTRDDTTGRQCSDLAEGCGLLSHFPPILCNLQKHRSTTSVTSYSTKALLPFIVPGLLRRLLLCHIVGALRII